jgi:TolB protein
MNVEMDCWLKKLRRILFSQALILMFLTGFNLPVSLLAQGGKKILLPGIESALAKKQIAIDLGDTSRILSPLIQKAFSFHGGFRLSHPKESQYSIAFSAKGDNQIGITIRSGSPQRVLKTLAAGGDSIDDALLRGCDKVVKLLLKSPGFFAGKISYLSNLSGHKEIFVSNSLMTTSRPNTNFKKITFNASWGNKGQGVFFTSNRQLFNNIFYLDLSSRKISTIANYRGSNLSAVQNPRDSQLALILSSTGNPEVWIAPYPNSKPKRLTRNKSNESGPCWSSDGRRLIVTSDSRGKPQLYEVSLSTGSLTRIATNVSSHCTEASWNPIDSSKISFTAAVGGGFQIFEYSFNSRKSKQLTKGVAHGLQSTWLNDGRHIVYTERSSKGSMRLMILDTELVGAQAKSLHGSNFGNCSQASFYYPN